jgi:Fe-S cluster assembly protein SufB
MSATTVQTLVNQPYKYGFVTDIETDTIPAGLSEDVIRLISAKKNEPEFMLEFRLKAYQQWLTMTEPDWANVGYPEINYQDIIYYSAPKQEKKKLDSLDDVDPAIYSRPSRSWAFPSRSKSGWPTWP